MGNWAKLAAIMVRPRQTMRAILDGGRDRTMLAILALAAVSGFAGDFDRGGMEALRQQRVPFFLLLIGLLLISILVTFLLFYLASWALYGVGRLLEGTGTPREVRTGVAWGLAPAVWALLYRVPIAVFWPESLPTKVEMSAGRWRINPGALGTSCLGAAVVGLLEFAIFVWCVWVMSNTIGESHRFSSWRGLATIVLTMISPALIALAAFLAS
jgi:hypothetical protein